APPCACGRRADPRSVRRSARRPPRAPPAGPASARARAHAEAAAAVAQRHHEHVQPRANAAERYRHLSPVTLRLLTRSRLEASLRQPCQRRLRPQRTYRQLHRLVAAAEVARVLELLE